AVGRRAGGTGRGRTLPRPSDLTAVAPPDLRWQPRLVGNERRTMASIRSNPGIEAIVPASRQRQSGPPYGAGFPSIWLEGLS
ncbi:MAG TPA: hypothetical protein VGS06_24900, partial [Streptosporangiaceae bacterium]|nr:hypothetical protein [Streptosporangiaceae bacterium]